MNALPLPPSAAGRRILVGTLSPLKVAAVEKVVAKVFGGGGSCDNSSGGDESASPARTTATAVVGVACESGVSEQPVGHEETLRGARNRLAACVAAADGAEDYCVAVESGIVEMAAGLWHDVAWVVLRDPSGNTVSIPSCGVCFPTEAVQAARARGFAKVTVGKVLAEQKAVAAHNDPHASLTRGHLRRGDYLDQALLTAFGQVLHGTP